MDTTQENPTSPPKIEKLTVTPAEAAHLMGCSRETVYRLIARGAIKCAPGLRTKIISRSALEKYLTGAVA